MGALPFYFSPFFHGFVDAVFECVSGFTTTGASILTDVEALPPSLLLWRAFTHWLGGLGIVLLMIAILPWFGAGSGSGGADLFRAEFSGAGSERLKPRLRQTVRALFRIYIGWTIAGIACLMLAGMGCLDAVCHTFAAIATGGYSTRAISVEAFHSAWVELILMALMVLGGMNFYQQYRMLTERKPRSFLADPEIRTYLTLLAVATLAVAASLWSVAGPLESVRLAAFQVVSVMTATGFSSTNFDGWPPFAQFVLVVSMFAGGCTGSTAGGLKSARVYLLFQVVRARLRTLVRPRMVVAIRQDRRILDEKEVQSALNVVVVAILVHLSCSLLLCASGLDLVSSATAAAATMFNVGPGLASVGPYGNYAHLTDLAKWVLVVNMIAGRLEFLTFFAVFTRPFWRP